MHSFSFFTASRRQFRSYARYATFISLACFAVLTIRLYLRIIDGEPSTTTPTSLTPQVAVSPTLHLLIPLTSPSLLFCRSFASSILTGYPPPVLVNYNLTFPERALARGAKIQGIASYLQGPVFPHADSDLVLVADGYDVWYQLPSDVLIRRFFESFPRNAVVFSAEKNCWPNLPDSPPCQYAPQSTLPKYAYGPETDKDPYKVRPRFLNSGTLLGEWSSVVDLYRRAAETVQRNGGFVSSDQGVLLDIWGEELVRALEDPNSGRDVQFTSGNERKKGNIVVDYESQLFMAMARSYDDLIWGWKNMTGNPNIESRFFFPFNSSPSTLSTPAEASDERLWLGTNAISQRTPALIHFNGRKFPLVSGWWERMWWFHPLGITSTPSKEVQQLAKDKFKAYIVAVRARAVDTPDWALIDGRFGGAWTDSGQWLDWSELCGEWDFIGRGGIWGT